MDIFDWVMDFMGVNELIPSKSLREEYSKSEFNQKMVLPSFEVLNEKIGMTKEVYDKLKERYKVFKIYLTKINEILLSILFKCLCKIIFCDFFSILFKNQNFVMRK